VREERTLIFNFRRSDYHQWDRPFSNFCGAHHFSLHFEGEFDGKVLTRNIVLIEGKRKKFTLEWCLA